MVMLLLMNRQISAGDVDCQTTTARTDLREGRQCHSRTPHAVGGLASSSSIINSTDGRLSVTHLPTLGDE